MSKTVVEIENLTVQYPLMKRPALKGINLSVKKGEFVGITGPCLAGKTTLILCLNGIIPHIVRAKIDGKVTVLGMDTRKYEPSKMAGKIGIVLDDPEPQMSQLTVEEEIAFGLQNLGIPRKKMIKRVREAMGLVGLTGLEKRAPIDLSGGQQQRLSIGSILAMHPEVLALDEPTSNLDPQGKQEVFSVVQKLNRERGVTVIISEHEVEWLAEFVDKLILLHNGEVISQGSTEEVFNQIELFKEAGERVPQVTELSYMVQKKMKWPYKRLPITLRAAHNKIGKLFNLE